jgi:5-methylthioadenosine/S-adenosylhomocysteine deaminase
VEPRRRCSGCDPQQPTVFWDPILLAHTHDAVSGPAAATIRGRVVITDAGAAVLRDGVVELDGATIIRVRPAREGDSGPVYDVLMPGLIDAHSHARATSVDRHGISGGPLERFLVMLRAMTALDPADEALVAADAGLMAGITSTQVIHHSFAAPAGYAEHGRAIASGYAEAGVRAFISLALSDQDEYAPATLLADTVPIPEPVREISTEGFMALVPALLNTASEVTFDSIGPVAPQWCSAATNAAIGATRGTARVHAHLLESSPQRLAASRCDPLVTLADAGLLGPFSSFAHGIWLTDQDRDTLAAAGATIVHNPGSNRRLGAGDCRVRALLDAGVNVALGIDSNGISAEPDMFAEMRLALEIAAGLEAPLRPAEVLAMATTGGAQALCRPGLGVLAPRTTADLIALQLPAAADAEDPIEHVVSHAQPEHVAARWIAGRRREPTGAQPARARLQAALEADAGARRMRLSTAADDWRRVQDAWTTFRARTATTS